MSLKNFFQNTVLISISFVIGYYVAFGPRGIVQYCTMHEQLKREKISVAGLTKNIDVLKQKINAHQSCPFELEKIARYDYGMGYTNEIIYVLPKA